MPDTFYSVSPHWGWYAVVEFFVAGLAGTAAGIAALLWLFGRASDRIVARWGFAIATVGSILSGLLLILDLKRPDRFWHMLLFSETFLPTFLKWWSVMALGAWSLFVFGGASFLALVGSLAVEGRLPASLRFLGRGILGTIIVVGSGLAGTFYAGYKGVLLNSTNRPLWGDTAWLGALFFASGMGIGGSRAAPSGPTLLALDGPHASPAAAGSARCQHRRRRCHAGDHADARH
jgi:protein NrfD